MKSTVFLFALLLLISCKQEKPHADYLGVVNISVSGKESAIPYFEKGLLLLHSFEYDDAQEAFLEAQQEDPQMPMAYWGEAMTYNHSLWSEQDYEAATDALAHLDELDLEAKATPLEQDLIQAAQILYQPKMEKKERDVAYAAYMEELYVKYPSNHEVAAFYALSLLGSVPEGRDDILYGKGALIAQGILEENPNHPGALHYTIHSYDDPSHASLALTAADAYAKVAPDASHALHMPSHIYVAMGMWDEVISSNINSYQASLNRMERKKLDNDARGYHAFHWLQYGYLMQDKQEEAKKMLLEMQQYSTETPSKRARVHLVFLKGTYMVNANEWEGELADIPIDVSDLNVSNRSQYQYLEGMKAYVQGNKTELDSIIKVMDSEHQRESFVVSNESAKLCSGASRGETTRTDLIEVRIRQNQLQALRATMDNNATLAEEHFLKAIELDQSISYSYGPPSIQKPTYELYADWLLSQGRMEEAVAQYEQTLVIAPKRLHAVKAMEKAKG